MKRNYDFSPESIRQFVPSTTGVYVLGNVNEEGQFIPGYVGRSDWNLQMRLLSHNHKGKFTHFKFEVHKTKADAFNRETELWHILKGENLLNIIHPDSPTGITMVDKYQVLAKLLTKRYGGYTQ